MNVLLPNFGQILLYQPNKITQEVVSMITNDAYYKNDLQIRVPSKYLQKTANSPDINMDGNIELLYARSTPMCRGTIKNIKH